MMTRYTNESVAHDRCWLKGWLTGLALAVLAVLPAAAGDGTDKESAFTVTQYLSQTSVSGFVWVKGYIVGSTSRNINNAQFAAGGSDTNILLAATVDCQDAAKVVPLELPKGSLRTALNLKDNPTNLGRFVVVQARAEDYFGVRGLRSPTTFAFVDDTPDLPDVPDQPDTPAVVHDTVYVEVERVDTAWVTVRDTIPVYVTVHDTLTLTDTLYVTQRDTLWRTEYITLHDTLTVRDILTDTLYVTRRDTLWRTEYITLHDTLAVHDTLTVHDILADTLYITRRDTLWRTEYITLHDTLTVHDTVVKNDTLFVVERDTLWQTEYVTLHDTLWQERVVVSERLDTLWRTDAPALPEPTILYDGHKVTIVSTAEDAVLYYTLDGTKPVSSTALRYDEPFVVTDDCVVTAVAVVTSSAASRGIDTSLQNLCSNVIRLKLYNVDGRPSQRLNGMVTVDENGIKHFNIE